MPLYFSGEERKGCFSASAVPPSQWPAGLCVYCTCMCLYHSTNEVKVKSLSHVSLFVIPRTVACQAPLSMGFSRPEYWSGLPCPSPGDLPDPGVESSLLHCRQILYRLSHQGNPVIPHMYVYIHPSLGLSIHLSFFPLVSLALSVSSHFCLVRLKLLVFSVRMNNELVFSHPRYVNLSPEWTVQIVFIELKFQVCPGS